MNHIAHLISSASTPTPPPKESVVSAIVDVGLVLQAEDVPEVTNMDADDFAVLPHTLRDTMPTYQAMPHQKAEDCTCQGYSITLPNGIRAQDHYPIQLHGKMVLPWEFSSAQGGGLIL